MPKHLWSLGLIKAINDPINHIIGSNMAVVIKDQYPKARYHYLVLPLENISSIHDLNSTHLFLLEEMHMLAVNIIEVKGLTLEIFKIGFHAEPNMERLHMHVISKDFISDSLKTKKHWNSFNTTFFIPYDDLLQHLKISGRYAPLEKATLDNLLKLDLKCNQCNFKPNNMPTLKQHILKHSVEKTSNQLC